MVYLRLTHMEAQELKLWGKDYKDGQESVGMGWDPDQQRIIDKLNKALGRSEGDKG